MISTELLHEIEQLPFEAQQQIEEFILRIKANYKPIKKTKLSEEEFVGLWSRRQDMQDSTAWVKNIRQSEWSKNHA